MNNEFDILIVTTADDFENNFDTFYFIHKFINYKEIVVVGSSKVLEKIKQHELQVSFINEQDIIDFNIIKKIINNRTIGKECTNRAGWYFQQFLKMSYAYKSKNKYYLIWDIDTIPLKIANFFDINNKPILHTKSEYHKPYFDTLKTILPNCKKMINESFICEHMMINKKIMINLIEDIQLNMNSSYSFYFEKILNSIDIGDLCKSGFSEFETYGNYVLSNPDLKNDYSIMPWTSYRNGKRYFNSSKLNDKTVKWLSRDFDAITFEKWDFIVKSIKLSNNFISAKLLLKYLDIIFNNMKRK